MADPVRTQIVDALVTALEGVTVANGYRQSITTVERLAKDWAYADMTNVQLPWAGVVPGDESTVTHLPFGYREIDWSVLVIVHFKVSDLTGEGLVDECEAIRTDIMRALYENPQLDVQGVMFFRNDGVQTSEASTESLDHRMGGLQLRNTVRFRESVLAA